MLEKAPLSSPITNSSTLALRRSGYGSTKKSALKVCRGRYNPLYVDVLDQPSAANARIKGRRMENLKALVIQLDGRWSASASLDGFS